MEVNKKDLLRLKINSKTQLLILVFVSLSDPLTSLLIQCNPLKSPGCSENESLTLFLVLPFSFYTVNEVQKFQYSRPVRKGEKDPDNEFAVRFFLLFYA